MMTISINVEPYLAHYMYARYANCIHEGAIKLSHRANLYHILLELRFNISRYNQTKY